MLPTQTTSTRRTRPRRFIPTPCVHPEARLLNQDILQFVDKASAITTSHETAQRDDRIDIIQNRPQQPHPDPQLQYIDALFERWDKAVETQNELTRWINGIKNEREREEARRVYDEVGGEWEDLGEVYGREGGWYVLGEVEGGVLIRWMWKRRGDAERGGRVVRWLGGVV